MYFSVTDIRSSVEWCKFNNFHLEEKRVKFQNVYMFWAQFLFYATDSGTRSIWTLSVMKLYHSRVGSEGGSIVLVLLTFRCPSGSFAMFLIFAWNRNPALALALCNVQLFNYRPDGLAYKCWCLSKSVILLIGHDVDFTPFVTRITRILASKNPRVNPFSHLSLQKWKRCRLWDNNAARPSVRPYVCLSVLVPIWACEPFDQISRNFWLDIMPLNDTRMPLATS